MWFGCNEKFTPGHRCQQPQAFFIEAFSPEELFGDPDVHEEKVDDEDTGGHDPFISLHAIVGCLGPRTMRVKAVIGKRELILLIDSGSTHNFVDQKLAQVLQLSVTPTEAFLVRVANSEKLICRERYKNVFITVQGFTFSLLLCILCH